ncbi:hypothetical protein ACUN8C_15220 [Kushneria sp. Sum13]|uniref:hypothetical protein n=1 Tax=Kushneria sp. Sum13 TaxID=3459196 RepID=UPI004045A248
MKMNLPDLNIEKPIPERSAPSNQAQALLLNRLTMQFGKNRNNVFLRPDNFNIFLIKSVQTFCLASHTWPKSTLGKGRENRERKGSGKEENNKSHR